VPGFPGDRLRPMPLPDGYRLRVADADDLPAIARLRESVGWAVHDWALRAVLEAPARCVVVTRRARPVAVGSGISYGRYGFVGNMVVDEGHRRRGLGSIVLEAITGFLEEAGCTRLELYATDAGRPLYARHGFEVVGPSTMARISSDLEVAPPAGTSVEPARVEHLELVVAYDRPRFGGDRGALVARMLADPERPVLVARRAGQIVGWGWLRPEAERIGPFVADDPRAAAAVLGTALAALPPGRRLALNLPGANRDGLAWLRGIGAELETWEGRMSRGEPIPRREETIYGNAVGALG
jgi:GNAT superfamily N-acetyltransferase